MVACKFFQQGSCRYGQNCRFDHIYGSKYSYHANAAPEAAQAGPVITDDQLVNQVHTYVQSILQGGQWLLSCYSPFKDKPSLPGLMDMSPEEARLLIYEAKANNNLDQAVAFMNNLFQEAKLKHELLLTKNPNITKVLRSLYNGEHVVDPFSNMQQTNTAFGNSAPSVFRSAVQQTPASVFSQNNNSSVFAQNNAFTSQDPAKSIFSQATQNVFQSPNQTSIFGQSPVQNSSSQPSMFAQAESTAQSIFAQASQNVFTQNAQQSNIFNTQIAQIPAGCIFSNASRCTPSQPSQQTPFGQASNPPTNVFQTTVNQSGFRAPNAFQQSAVDTGVYSKVEELSAEDVEAFNSEDFKMGFIPEVPPPQSLCI